MELHNSYTVQDRGGAQTAFNTVTDDFLQVFCAYADWARFLVLTKADGTRVASPCTLQFINADILKGGDLRAVYTASIDGQTGATYTKVSLAVAADGPDVSCADISFTGSGDPVSITAVMVLDCAYDGDLLLTGGDNPLVRRILGAGEEGEFAVATGTHTYPSYPSLRSDAMISSSETVTPRLENGQLVFDGALKMRGCELLLLYCGQAVLRAMRPYSYKNTALSFAVRNGSVAVAGYYADSVVKLTVANVAVTNYDVMRACTNALKVNENTVAVGVDGTILSDPGEEYAAVVTHSYAEVFRVDARYGAITPLLRVPRQNEVVLLCRGGTLVVWGDTELTLYQRDENDAYTSATVAIPKGEKNLVLREGVRYHVAVLRGSTFYRYAVLGGGVTTLEETAVTNPASFSLGRCGDAAVFGETAFTVRTIDIDYTNEYACAAFSNKSDVTGVTAGNYFVAAHTAGGVVLYDFVRNTTHAVEGGYTVSGRLLYKAGAPLLIYDVANGVRTLGGDFTTQGLSSACLAGGYLFTVTDGIMKCFYLSGGDIAVRLPVSGNGKRCNVTVRNKSMQGSAKLVQFTVV